MLLSGLMTTLCSIGVMAMSERREWELRSPNSSIQPQELDKHLCSECYGTWWTTGTAPAYCPYCGRVHDAGEIDE